MLCSRFPRGPMVKRDLIEETPPPNPFSQMSHVSPGDTEAWEGQQQPGRAVPRIGQEPAALAQAQHPQTHPRGTERGKSLTSASQLSGPRTQGTETARCFRGEAGETLLTSCLWSWGDGTPSLPLGGHGQGMWPMAAKGPLLPVDGRQPSGAEPEVSIWGGLCPPRAV